MNQTCRGIFGVFSPTQVQRDFVCLMFALSLKMTGKSPEGQFKGFKKKQSSLHGPVTVASVSLKWFLSLLFLIL